jgi:4-aminobutyrate aminotransferase/(S)-3-amino-2-methylpropionate transaminase
MIAVELVEAGSLTPDPVLTAAVAAEARRHGVIVLTCGTDNNVLRFLPPLTIGEDLLDEALDVIAAAFEVTR